MTAYLETSAVAKLVVEETESAALAAQLDELAAGGVRLVSSVLLETELRRLAVREELPQSSISAVLERIDLVEPDRALYVEAGLLPGRNSRSLDALHIATALRLQADSFVAYDQRQCAAADSVGLKVTSPR